MERGSFFRLFFILLAFSQLITSTTAVSFSTLHVTIGAQRFLQQSRSFEGSGDSLHKVPQVGKWWWNQRMSNREAYKAEGDDLISWRMDMELNDYTGSGPNNHHTPPRPSERN